MPSCMPFVADLLVQQCAYEGHDYLIAWSDAGVVNKQSPTPPEMPSTGSNGWQHCRQQNASACPRQCSQQVPVDTHTSLWISLELQLTDSQI